LFVYVEVSNRHLSETISSKQLHLNINHEKLEPPNIVTTFDAIVEQGGEMKIQTDRSVADTVTEIERVDWHYDSKAEMFKF